MAANGATTDTPTPTPGPAPGPTPAGPSGAWPSVSDLSQDGPFPSTTMLGVGPDGGHTVYLPSELGGAGLPHPVIGWMSGGGTMHKACPLLPRLATHGFIVVAADVVPGIGEEAMLG